MNDDSNRQKQADDEGDASDNSAAADDGSTQPVEFVPFDDAVDSIQPDVIPIVDAEFADAPVFEAIPIDNETDDDVIIAEIVDEPRIPALKVDERPPHGIDRAAIAPMPITADTMRSLRFRRRGRYIVIILASLIGLMLVGFFEVLRRTGAFSPREQVARKWYENERWYDDGEWYDEESYEDDLKRRIGTRRSDRARREWSRFDDQIEELPAIEWSPIENLDETIAADEDWPYSALTGEPIAAVNEPLRSTPYQREPKPVEYESTTQDMAGENVTARQTRIISPYVGSKLLDVAWSEDGSTLYALDHSGFVTRVEADPLRATLAVRIENALAIEVCRSGVVVALAGSIVVLDPLTLEPRNRFVALSCQDISAGVRGSRVVISAFSKLSVIDLEKAVLEYRIDAMTTRPIIDEPYRQTDLAGSFERPTICADGDAFLAVGNGRMYRFDIEADMLHLLDIRPQNTRVLTTAILASDPDIGIALSESDMASEYANDVAEPKRQSTISWFESNSEDEFLQSAIVEGNVAAAAVAGGASGTAFLLTDDGVCHIDDGDGNSRQIRLLGVADAPRISARYSGTVADPARCRVAVFNDELLWIVEPTAVLKQSDE